MRIISSVGAERRLRPRLAGERPLRRTRSRSRARSHQVDIELLTVSPGPGRRPWPPPRSGPAWPSSESLQATKGGRERTQRALEILRTRLHGAGRRLDWHACSIWRIWTGPVQKAAGAEAVSFAADSELLAAVEVLAAARATFDAAELHVLGELDARGVCDREFGSRTATWVAHVTGGDRRAIGCAGDGGREAARGLLDGVDAALSAGRASASSTLGCWRRRRTRGSRPSWPPSRTCGWPGPGARRSRCGIARCGAGSSCWTRTARSTPNRDLARNPCRSPRSGSTPCGSGESWSGSTPSGSCS